MPIQMQHDLKQHWERMYTTKMPDEMSWTQAVPSTSLGLIQSLAPNKFASIIDVGGGDSTLVDYLLKAGYQNLTVLDVSATALRRAQRRLGALAANVKWIEADITQFVLQEKYDVWHDRAVFHFLTTSQQAQAYLSVLKAAVKGYLIMATFSEQGPETCSALPVKRYSHAALQETMETHFERIGCHAEDHRTPFGTTQNFLFCRFKKRAA